MIRWKNSVAVMIAALISTQGQAQPVDNAYSSAAARLFSSSKFAAVQAALRRSYDQIISDTVNLAEIPAPPLKEGKRALAFLGMLRAAGLTNVEMDREGNVMGLRNGRHKGRLLIVTAHLDTVFPEGTNVKVRREGNRLYGPGIGDDTASLAVVLGFVRALNEAGVQTDRDILFMGNVGEEGPGNLRGIRYFFEKGSYKDRIGQFISIESGRARVINGGVGSNRYKVTFDGPGGHSLHDFGLVNPAYAMANAITTLGQMKVPASPKTVYNVGVVEGGTSVNSIPQSVSMTIDMRSEGQTELNAENKYFIEMLPLAVAAENIARSTAKGKITYQLEDQGSRPVGFTPVTTQIVQTSLAMITAFGVTPHLESGSTDSNIPMSRGVPAVTIGSGFAAERVHTMDENIPLDQQEDVRHMTIGLSIVMALAGANL